VRNKADDSHCVLLKIQLVVTFVAFPSAETFETHEKV